MIRRACLLAVLLTCTLSARSVADGGPPVPVRVGSHPGYGRIVFDLPAHTDYQISQQGQNVTIQFNGALTIGSAKAVPHNVMSIAGSDGQANLVVAPGTTLHSWRLGDHVVVDVLDPGGEGGGASQQTSSTPGNVSPVALAPAPTQSAPQQQQELAAPSPPSPAVPAAPGVPEAPAVTAPPVQQADTPPDPQPPSPSRRAGEEEKPEPPQVSSLDVPFDAPLGVAVFRRGNVALVVFDRQVAIDLAPLREHPVFGSASVQSLPDATVVQVPLDPSTALSHWSAHRWRIDATSSPPNPRPIMTKDADGRLLLTAAMPGSVVALSDPASGATLLVGTQRRDGQGVAAQHRSVEFTLLPTWQGVAVVPASDRVAVRATQDGFILTAAPASLALSPASEGGPPASAAGLTRRFDFPDKPTSTLMLTLQRQEGEAAMTPALARGPRRVAVARTLIALGMGAEAQAVLRLAADDDPQQAASADSAALGSIAALLAHRPDEAGGLNDSRLNEADDVELWRAVRQAQLQQGSASAAATLAAAVPLLLGYPAPLRDHILPLAAETMATGGEQAAAASLLDARKNDTSLDLARGMLQEAKGDTAGALATYDRLTQSPDRLVYARAAVRAVELRLASGVISEREAADRLDKLLYAWRGDASELALRERLADLRARSGAWRAALGLLRENEALFPAQKPVLHAKLADVFAAFLRTNAADGLSPLELVSLVNENTELLPDGPDGEALEERLADRLLALDLPRRAGPVLEKLMHAAPTGVGRAAFGTRLAAMRAAEGDTQGALAALAESDGTDLPPNLAERRGLLLADAYAKRGDMEHALALLTTMATAAADEARATILERAGNWPAAQRALADYVAKAVPSAGTLDNGQRRTLLRLATAAARAGDGAGLSDLRQREASRMGKGPLAEMFRLLTAAPVRSVEDLKRSGQEAALARGLAGDIKTLQQRQTR